MAERERGRLQLVLGVGIRSPDLTPFATAPGEQLVTLHPLFHEGMRQKIAQSLAAAIIDLDVAAATVAELDSRCAILIKQVASACRRIGDGLAAVDMKPGNAPAFMGAAEEVLSVSANTIRLINCCLGTSND